MEKIQCKRPYRHFKGNLYYVHDIYMHSETGEWLVAYQALYGSYGMFLRPLASFEEKVPEGRNDNVYGQEYRFELYDSAK